MPPRLPDRFTVRPPALADADEVAALINACNEAEIGQRDASRDMVLTWWQEPGRHLADESWLVIAPDGHIAAYLELYAPAPAAQFDGFVHPSNAGVGIGAFLLDTIEQRVRRDLRDVDPHLPVTLQTNVWEVNQPAQRLLAARGFTHVRDGLRMEIDLSTPPPAPEWPPGICVRRFVLSQDERAVYEVAEAAFADTWHHAPRSFEVFLHERITSVQDFDPSLWFLAVEDGRIAGVALCLAEQPGQPGIGWISLLGVAWAWRGRGVAMALLRAAFDEFYQRGTRRVGLGVDGASPTGADRLYRRAGMRVVQRGLTYEKELRPATVERVA